MHSVYLHLQLLITVTVYDAQEAPWKVSPEPAETWPDEGKVEFNNYQVRYREGLELVLRGITFQVQGGEKVSKFINC